MREETTIHELPSDVVRDDGGLDDRTPIRARSTADSWLAAAPGTFDESPYEQLLAKIETGTAQIGIIGLGYVGLPLAATFSHKYSVLGFDVDAKKVSRLKLGESYIGHLSSQVITEIKSRGFVATTDFSRLDEPDAILICVPTPLTETREPDLTYVIRAAEVIAKVLRPGQLVVLESTTYPGTTRQVVLRTLERSGLQAGKDFFLAYSPEREDPGNCDYSTSTIPKVVGGLDAPSLRVALALYEDVVSQVVPVSSTEVAEACKILENTYRAVNIALVNELKILFDKMGIDVWEVIDAAKTKPFGFQAFFPGPGLGGHCIPIDPFYLTWIARKYGMSTRFIELAGEINTSMPTYVINRLGEALNAQGKPIRGSRVVILGMAYKKNTDDPRESPGFELMELLLHRGAIVSYNDPHIPVLPQMRRYPQISEPLTSEPLTEEFLSSQDCVLIATDHSAYDWSWIVSKSRLIVDTRNATRGLATDAGQIVRS